MALVNSDIFLDQESTAKADLKFEPHENKEFKFFFDCPDFKAKPVMYEKSDASSFGSSIFSNEALIFEYCPANMQPSVDPNTQNEDIVSTDGPSWSNSSSYYSTHLVQNDPQIDQKLSIRHQIKYLGMSKSYITAKRVKNVSKRPFGQAVQTYWDKSQREICSSEHRNKPISSYINKSSPNFENSDRLDVIIKGSMRLVRKVLRNYLASKYSVKRLRSERSKRKQLQNSLDIFLNDFNLDWVLNLKPILWEDYDLWIQELIGRVAHSTTYDGLPIKWYSSMTAKISKFCKLYHQCWRHFTQTSFNELYGDTLFGTLIKLYTVINNEMDPCWASDKDQRYVPNIEWWAAELY